MMKLIDLGYQKINMCPNFCMLYYLENAKLTECKTYRHARYKPRTGRERTLVAYRKLRHFPITPRQQRLFMSPKTDKHITWHHSPNMIFCNRIIENQSNNKNQSVYIINYIQPFHLYTIYVSKEFLHLPDFSKKFIHFLIFKILSHKKTLFFPLFSFVIIISKLNQSLLFFQSYFNH
jgi:hypothetical protein